MCSHQVVVDYIDVDPDKSQQIFYCEKCFATFCHKEYMEMTLYDNSSNALTELTQENQQQHSGNQ
jgi:hypothetical protein